jgi:hypothetical protein
MPGQKREARLHADVAGIHVFLAAELPRTWMPGIKPGMTSNYFIILLTKP